MVRVALIDDNPQDMQTLRGHIDTYAEKTGETFSIEQFSDGLLFLDHFAGNYDVIFMDIEMPHLNGIDVARKMRQADLLVALIFVTNMAKYAVSGYEVGAIDYMVKPVSYPALRDKLSRAIASTARDRGASLLIHNGDAVTRLRVMDIYYLEKDKNYIVFHTEQGVFRQKGAMTEYAQQLAESGFSKCAAGCLVNLWRVKRLSKENVWVDDGTCLPIARPQRKEFTERFLSLLGGGN